MVRLTATLCKYIPEWFHLQKSGGSYFKKQNILYMNRFYRRAGWSCHKHAMNRFYYHLQGEMFNAKQESNHRRDYNRMRIAAACDEHGYKYQHLMSTLPKIDIHLNLYSLARLAIYEPRTFKTLVEISRRVGGEPLPEQSQIDFKSLESSEQN